MVGGKRKGCFRPGNVGRTSRPGGGEAAGGAMAGFTHLHTASGFSARYGATHPERLAERAAERGLDALALTDRDSLAGTVRFARAAARAGVRPLFGVDLAVRDPEPEPGPAVRRRTPVRGGAFVDESAPRAVFLARDGAYGWAALCALVSAAHAGGTERPELRHADLAGAAAGLRAPLTVLLGPGSEVGRALAAGRPDRAARLLAPWRELFGDGLRLEAVWHGRTGTGPGSLRLAARTVGFAAEHGVRAVLTNAVRYADPGQGPVADVLDAARLLVPVDPRRPEALDGGERWLKGASAMADAAERIAEAAGERREGAHRLLTTTEETAAECLVDPEGDLGLGTVHFPEPHLVGGPGGAPPRACCAPAAPRPWCCAATTATAATGTGWRRSWPSSRRGASPRTSSPSRRSSTTPGRSASGSPPAAPARARSSTTCSASRTPTPSRTACSWSASCRCAGPRCPTSTSTWSPRAAWTSTARSSTASARSASPPSPCPRPTGCGTRCGTWARPWAWS
ncbi:hypothetical protein GCM10020000_63670 [Streptomyces olivoverticillatus]